LYTTDVEAFLAQWETVRARFEPGAVPPNTLVQVVRFAHPAIRVEIEASAVRSARPVKAAPLGSLRRFRPAAGRAYAP
jgi:hypothetical protein